MSKDKPPLALLPSAALIEVARVAGHGAEKYSPEDWRGKYPCMEHISAAIHHMLRWKDVSHKDPESKLSHLAHAACRILFALDQELTGHGLDDSWVAMTQEDRDRAVVDKLVSMAYGNPWSEIHDVLQEDDENTGPIII